jgi:hypothetical protein
MPIPRDELSIAAKFLKNAAPREWDAFVAATRGYLGRLLADLPKAAEDVQVRWMQGGARTIYDLLQKYDRCDAAEPPLPPPPSPPKEAEKPFNLTDLIAKNPPA